MYAMAACGEQTGTFPKIKQLFDSPPSSSTLPDIHQLNGRPAQMGGTIRGMAVSAPAQPNARKEVLPLTPAQALERYMHILTSHEKEEIAEFPQVFFVGQLAKKINAAEGKGPNLGFDDDKERYKTVKNDHIAYRYEVLKGLGRGSFGDVVRAFDHKTKADVALKIIRNERRFHKQAASEIKILDLLRKQDKRGSHHLIHLKDYFLFRGHLCLTFEMLGPDLYSALKKDGFKGFPLPRVQHFSSNILACLRVLRRSHIIHCDLKPENILLTNSDSDDIVVIDFGSSCFDHQKVHTYIQSRFYRAPEVILGSGYALDIDMWSLGCIVAELYTGHPLFPGRDEKEQLLYQMEVLGLPTPAVLSAAKRTSIFFDEEGTPRQLIDRKGRKRMPGTRSMERALGSVDPTFIDFVTRCLAWDPAHRITPREASRHPFVLGKESVVLPELPALTANTPVAAPGTISASQRSVPSSSISTPAAPIPAVRRGLGSFVGFLSPKSRKKVVTGSALGMA